MNTCRCGSLEQEFETEYKYCHVCDSVTKYSDEARKFFTQVNPVLTKKSQDDNLTMWRKAMNLEVL